MMLFLLEFISKTNNNKAISNFKITILNTNFPHEIF